MASTLYLIVLLLAVFSYEKVSCLKCNACYSRKSLGDCRTEERSVNCNDDDVCFVARSHIYGQESGLEIVHKGCKKAHQCNAIALCGSMDCTFSCCQDGHCNSSTKHASTLMLSFLFSAFSWLLVKMAS